MEFDNKNFWENRYKTNLELGSGRGSRGKPLCIKKTILNKILEEFKPDSVLDVGCGDIEVVKDLPMVNYTGIDLSPFIMEKNRIKRPNWRFITGDFIELYKKNPLESDLVICFDVLIHQFHYETYQEIIRLLSKCCRKICLLSGFEESPGSKFPSETTAFHEPITRTLRKVGIEDMKTIGKYRNATIVFFKKSK